jgi:hypothetical protein
MARSPDPRLEQYWLRHLRCSQASRLTVRQYCQVHQLREASFYAWKRTLRERGLFRDPANTHTATPPQHTPASTTFFLPVSVPAPDAAPNPIDIVLPDGLRLRVAAGFDQATLRQLLALLREPSC